MFFDVNELNYLAILVGGLLYMMYGGIYYSIKLGKKNADSQSKGPLKYVVSVIVAFISSFFVGGLVQATGADSIVAGASVGIVIGLLISIVYLKNMLFGLLTKRAFMIVIGDHLVIFTLLGVVHGVMG